LDKAIIREDSEAGEDVGLPLETKVSSSNGDESPAKLITGAV